MTLIASPSMTMAFLRAPRIRSRESPYKVKYSRAEGMKASFCRSFCSRSIMTTSAPSIASSMRLVTRAPRR